LHRPAPDASLPTDAETAAARDFIAEQARLGTRVVLTRVPQPGGRDNASRTLAARIGATFVEPTGEPLRLRDQSHLTAASADVFTRAFLAEFRKTPEYGEILQRKKP
jgi:hypothetical protein